LDLEEWTARRIINELKNGHLTSKEEFSKLKFRASSEEGLKRVLKDHEIISYLHDDESCLIPILRSKEVRAASGIYTIAVMTKPWKCPKENPCLYCPGGVKDGTPQSYLGNEPALMRGIQTKFDPYIQVAYRLDQYKTIGHQPSKVQLIVMGGTFPATDLDYQEWFITRCLCAMNDYNGHLGAAPDRWMPLEETQERNASARVRCIGITMETRPDWARIPQTDRMIRLGATLVEVGVQSLDDRILEGVGRGHTVGDTVNATRTLRDSGLKVGFHMMPGLPGSNFNRDLDDLKAVFEDERFKPDYIKIYPTLVIEGTGLFELWKSGKYRGMPTEDAIELLTKAHGFFPKWVRVARIQRDTPAYMIADGVNRSNLRELVDERLRSLGIRCNCIRCREVGLAGIRHDNLKDLKPRVTREPYCAGGGMEEFLSVEDTEKGILIGFLRLRIPSETSHRREVRGAGVIRELHVYGRQLPVGDRLSEGFQHHGWGAKLLQRAEEVTSGDYGLSKIVVLPGVGVRDYYRGRGYHKVRGSMFMSKDL
jgi:elongator complex protein 3